MAQVLPLRFRVLHFLSDRQGHTLNEVMEALKEEYGGEGQFNDSLVGTHLQSLKAVGMLEHSDVFVDDEGKLVVKYKITDYGYGRLEYLPNGWEARVK